MPALSGILGDGVIAGDILAGAATVTTNAQAFSVTDALSFVWIPGAVITEKLGVGEAISAQGMLNASRAEGISFASKFQVAAGAAIGENLLMTSSFAAQVNWVIREVMRVGDALGVTAKTNLTLNETARIGEVLASPVYGRILAEAIELTDAQISYAYIAGVSLVEQMLFADQLTNRIILRVQFADDVNLDDDPLANFIYSTGFADNIVADVLYQTLGSGVTSWAINTRTNAITEYKNFAFNSVAPFGRKYVAADENGLYELNGSRDLTVNILSELAGGYLQINGAKFTGFKAAYLGVRGQGNYLLKLIGGDGTVRIYRALSNPGLMTTKIDIGKGIRTRYIAWELVNEDGQDFDLDTIEFIPMKSARRV